MRSHRQLRADVLAASCALHERGWVANHDGNITVRIASDRFLATPTATSKGQLTDRDLIEVDTGGKLVAGSARPFGELSMHLAVYDGRGDVNAVVHAHPPYATALACSGSNLIERPFIAEAVVSLGPQIPLVPFALPGPAARDALAARVNTVDAVLCQNHGVFAWGSSLEIACLRLELVEHLAKIATLAQATGGIKALPDSAMEPLLAARERAGLGHAADNARSLLESSTASSPARVVACAPAPHAPNVEVIPPGKSSQLVAIIRDELNRALGES